MKCWKPIIFVVSWWWLGCFGTRFRLEFWMSWGFHEMFFVLSNGVSLHLVVAIHPKWFFQWIAQGWRMSHDLTAFGQASQGKHRFQAVEASPRWKLTLATSWSLLRTAFNINSTAASMSGLWPRGSWLSSPGWEPWGDLEYKTKPPGGLGGSSHVHRVGGLVHPSYVCGRLAPTYPIEITRVVSHKNDSWVVRHPLAEDSMQPF